MPENLQDPILNPTVELYGFKWAEPFTTLTDFLVALVCWYAVYRLTFLPKAERNNKVYPFFLLYFLCFAIGMTSAAWLGHGFQEYISPRFKVIGWCFSATGLMCLQHGSIRLISLHQKPIVTKAFHVLFVLQWLVALALMINPQTSTFMVAQVNSVIALIVVILPIHLFSWKKIGNDVSLGIIVALTYSLIPGMVYNNQYSFHRWCNYHDISHLLMAIFMFLMFRSIFKLSSKTIMT